MMRRRISLSDRQGFTLAEMLIVVAIIAILTSISVPAYNKVYSKVKKQTMDSNTRIISSIVEDYLAQQYEEGKLGRGILQKITDVPLGDSQNPLYGSIDGGDLKDIQILYININLKTGEYQGLELIWDDYIISYTKGSDPVIEKEP